MNETPTQQEIVDRINEKKKNDFMGWETSCYFDYLDYKHLEQFFAEGAKFKDGYNKDNYKPEKLTRNKIISIMEDYMPFAIGKAEDERGISASRSIAHFIGWTWLAGDKDFSDKIRKECDENYYNYGKKILEMICDEYNIDKTRD